MNNVGERIHALRLANNLTLQELGDKVGVGASTVRKWETGYIKNLKTDKVKKLASALDTTGAYLMGWEEHNINVTGSSNNIYNHSHLAKADSLECGELIRIYNALPVKARHKLLSLAFELEETLCK